MVMEKRSEWEREGILILYLSRWEESDEMSRGNAGQVQPCKRGQEAAQLSDAHETRSFSATGSEW
jgi:hypothetical protein